MQVVQATWAFPIRCPSTQPILHQTVALGVHLDVAASTSYHPPGDGFWSPVLVVIINIRPLILTLSIIFIKATSHVDAVLLEFLVSEFFRFGG